MGDIGAKKFGLLGERLGHSYSPRIHSLLYDEPYKLYEVSPGELEAFLRTSDVAGLNVTVPYKKQVLPFCRELSERAERIGSVNTLVRTQDGGWRGDNTDYDGFRYALSRCGVPVAGRKVLVLGSGGASLAVRAVLDDAGARTVVVSRSGEDNYGNLDRHRDAVLLVNATPVGMYPHNGSAPVDLRALPALEGVCDLIYNPARTALLLQAEELGLACENGLGMLVAQAVRSASLFTGRSYAKKKTVEIAKTLERETRNVILIGMPGCGKTLIGRALARALSRPFVDVDEEAARELGMPVSVFITRHGEDAFRERETALLRRIGAGSGQVVATGGGCVTREENYPLLHQNGRIFWLWRPLSLLATRGRPLSAAHGVKELYRRRREQYARFADVSIDNEGRVQEAVRLIMEVL